MKFSEAFLLGETLKRSDPTVWFRPDPLTGEAAGCAIFGAALAVGFSIISKTELNISDEIGWLFDTHRLYVERLFEFVTTQWPWIGPDNRYWISELYRRVCSGTLTLEGMVDWLREMEPKEPQGPKELLPISGVTLSSEILSRVE